MKTAKNSLGIKTHLRIGIFYGTLAGIIQGFAEGFILSICYNGYIFGPQDIFKSQIFVVISKILHFDESESIPFILDRYLGPNFIDKIQLIYNLIAIYAIVGLIIGICLGIFLWIAFRFIKSSLDSERLSILYFSFLLSFIIFINLIILLDRKDIISTFTIAGLLINLGLIANALFFSGLIYKLGCTLVKEKSLKNNKTFSSEVFKRQSEVVLLSVGLITCIALILNFWIFREDKRALETFAAQIEHNTANRSTNLNDKNINVVLISIDTLRADHLSCYGYSRKTSPNIDKLANEGVLFSNAFSVTSWTVPAHMSMLTSMYPEAHGVITDKDRLDESRLTLAEVLRKEGYVTAAFISGPTLNSIFGFNQGFDLYDDFTDYEAVEQQVTSPKLNEAIQRWLRKNYQKKFFLFLHYFDVHNNYIPPPPYDTMFDPNYKGTIDGALSDCRVKQGMNPRDLIHMIALYDGEIAFTDKYVGELLSALRELGIYDKTLIILTSDHGEEFFEHGRVGHRHGLYDEVLHVPLILKFPSSSNLGGNKRVEEIVSIIDIMPTILDYIGVKLHEEMQGWSLLSLLNGNKKSNDFLIYSSLDYHLAAVRSASSKFIYDLKTPKKEFYDLVNDPQEKINLFDKRTSESAPGGERNLISLLNWLNTQRQFYQALPNTGTKKKTELGESMKQQLKALGYIQ